MNIRTGRRTFIKGVTAAGAVAVGPWIAARPAWSQHSSIKIGVIEPLSGPIAYVGETFVAAARFGAYRLNRAGGVLGRQVEIVPADSELKPDVATRRANDLLYREKVEVLAVGPGSAVAKAVSQIANRNGKIFVTYASEAAELTGEEFQDTTFRCCLNTDMHSRMLALYFTRMAKQKPTRFYLLNEDYNFGHAFAEGFKKAFDRMKAPNQSIVGEEYHPLQNVQDFAPYVTKIMASGAEVVITGDWGQDLRLLLQQGKSLGWKVKTGGFYLNDPIVLQAVQGAAVGHITADAYQVTLDTPENKAFIREWREYYPDAPISYKYPNAAVIHTVSAILWLGDVIKRAGTLDTARLIQTWEGARFAAILGDVEMRACDHQMQSPGLISEILDPEQIPAEIRYYGDAFPYIGRPTRIPKEELAVIPKDTGNPRCARGG
ncbi:ABC transporter substrate-binding protein [Paraburkholderia sp. HP33-1]|uniref:ABC transporter substrate-binding protein n=1 Tax=Paraburkholderia sp. HP33-1 TaxID=2883243 RepID=UPI001F2DE0B3|nr:ABC transporter substrate-binding protein [Paraburkholderia sp. HP33-1]